MVFNTGAALLDAIVLAVVASEAEGTYGYKITQDVRGVLDVSESTLYPVLRRLQKDDCLEVYDMAYAGRNRRYYKLTEKERRSSISIKWNGRITHLRLRNCLREEFDYEQGAIYGTIEEIAR